MQRVPALSVACDFDGTLTSIVQRPTQTHLPERARDAIVRLAGCPDVEVAVLSGRRLDDLEEHLGVPGMFLAGQAGLETRMPSGSRKIHVEAADRLSAGLIAEMQTWVSGF